MKKFIYLIVFLLSVSVTVTGQTSKELPNITLKTMDGKEVALHSMMKKDGVTIISLWATWCVPCLKELDAISDVYEDWQDETNFKLVAVSVDDSRTVRRVKSLVNGKGWDYEVLLDTNLTLKRALNATTVPVTLIIKDNKIVYEHMGYTPGSENELYEKVKSLTE